jgi:hypothetical protein
MTGFWHAIAAAGAIITGLACIDEIVLQLLDKRIRVMKLVFASACALEIFLLLTMPVGAAEPRYCRLYADTFAMVYQQALDRSLLPYWRDRVESRCLNKDEEPGGLVIPGTVPATDKPKGGGALASDERPAPDTTKPPTLEEPHTVLSAWEALCAKRYKTFDPKSGTVIRYRTKTRVKCPVKP